MSIFWGADLRDHIADIDVPGVATLPGFLKEETRLTLLMELACYDFKEEPLEYGPHSVRQNFRTVREFAPGGLCRVVRNELEAWLQLDFTKLPSGFLAEPLSLTEMRAQRYEPTEVGISAHRDEKRYINLVAILVLEGKGRFLVSDDREGTNAVEIRNNPGDLLLMRATGFSGSDYRPFHRVEAVTERRTTLTFRQEKA